MKITKVNKAGIDLIKQFEGLRLKPYLCSASVPTVGYGSTTYPNGVKVTMKDAPITEAQAEEFLAHDLIYFEKQVDAFTTDAVNQNQFNSLVSFAYNCGVGNLKSCTLLKKVNANPNDPSIAAEFAKWTRAAGKVVQGLVNRRKKESDLYFTK
jgi:lysozyme